MDDVEMNGIQFLFMDLAHLVFQRNFGVLKEYGVHPGQIPILGLLAEEGGLSQREIADRLKITPPAVTASAKRLEKNGIIERKVDEKDQRVVRLYITEKGIEVKHLAWKIWKKNEKEILYGFEEGEIYLLRRFLQHMIANLQEMEGDDEKL